RAIFHYIEMFYNPKRRHTHNQRVSPMNYEKQYFMNQKSV
ncbi:IS3 family transposase, partial [Paenalcaligenes sp.]